MKQEQLIKKAVDKYGKEKVIKILVELGMLKPEKEEAEVSTLDTCSTGYYWSVTLQRCVLEVGSPD